MIRAALLWLALALPLAAQDLPNWTATSINDFAGVLSNDDTRIIDQALIALHEDTGVQGTVVTVTDRARYGGTDGLEPFATRLFNHWGVGEAERNDGFMLVMLRDDREVRIELGAGYPPAADNAAQAIINRTILPEFRSGRYSDGLRDGTVSIINDIARPHAAGLGFDGPSKPKRSFREWILILCIGGLFSFAGFRVLRDIWQRIKLGRQPCPDCGNSGLVQESEIIEPGDSQGRRSQVIWRRCRKCGWTSPRSDPKPISRAFRRSGGGGFGGGRSSGGGASGRW